MVGVTTLTPVIMRFMKLIPFSRSDDEGNPTGAGRNLGEAVGLPPGRWGLSESDT